MINFLRNYNLGDGVEVEVFFMEAREQYASTFYVFAGFDERSKES